MLTFKQIAVSSSSTCGLSQLGSIFCWGKTSDFASGFNNLALPVLVNSATAFTSFSVGHGQVCALDAGGKAFCFG